MEDKVYSINNVKDWTDRDLFGKFYTEGEKGVHFGKLSDARLKPVSETDNKCFVVEGQEYELFLPAEEVFMEELVGFGQKSSFITTGAKGIFGASVPHLKQQFYYYESEIEELINIDLESGFPYKTEEDGYSFFYPIEMGPPRKTLEQTIKNLQEYAEKGIGPENSLQIASWLSELIDARKAIAQINEGKYE